MPRAKRQRQVIATILTAVGVFVLAAILGIVGRFGGGSLDTMPTVGFAGVARLHIVGFSTESAWWLTPRVVQGPGGALAVTVPSDVLFAVDSADLGPDAQPAITEVANLAAVHPSTTISAACFTDGTGLATWNKALSQARARAVAAALIAKGVPAASVTANGFGATDFVASNDTPSGRASNRRCQFTLIGAS